MIRAILWAQWRSLLNARIGSSRWAGALAMLAAALWYGFWTALAIAAFVFASGPRAVELESILPRTLMFAFLYWQLAPVLTASVGASLDLRKLRLYPVPESRLFYLEAGLRMTTAVELILLMAGVLLGVSRNPAWNGSGNVARLALFFAILAFHLPLAAGLSSLLDRLLARRWIREVALLALVFVAVLPQFLLYSGKVDGAEQWLSSPAAPYWPWTAAAHIALSSGSVLDWGVLVAWIGLACLFGRLQFRRSLGFDGQAAEAASRGARTDAPRWTAGVYGLPVKFLRDPLGALVEKELHSLGRSPRFRTVFLMGFTFGLIVWIPIAFRRGAGSPMAAHFLTVACVYAITLLGQVSYWNVFGFDRAAIQTYLLWPVPMRAVLISKNVATAFFVALEIVFVVAAAVVFRVQLDPGRVAEALCATAVTGLFLVAAGNLASVYVPRPVNTGVLLKGAGTDRRQNFILLLTFPVALLPLALAYLAQYGFSSDLAFYVVLGVFALVGAATYHVSLDAAIRVLERKRESIVADLTRGSSAVSA